MYFYYDPGRCFKYVRPVERLEGGGVRTGVRRAEQGRGAGRPGPRFFAPGRGPELFGSADV